MALKYKIILNAIKNVASRFYPMNLLWNAFCKKPHDTYIANVLFHLTGKRKVLFEWNLNPKPDYCVIMTCYFLVNIKDQQSSHTLTRKSSAKNQHSVISPSCHCKPTCFFFLFFHETQKKKFWRYIQNGNQIFQECKENVWWFVIADQSNHHKSDQYESTSILQVFWNHTIVLCGNFFHSFLNSLQPDHGVR